MLKEVTLKCELYCDMKPSTLIIFAFCISNAFSTPPEAEIIRVSTSIGHTVMGGGSATKFGGGQVPSSGQPYSPIGYTESAGVFTLAGSSVGESQDASDFGVIYYTKSGTNFSPFVYTSTGTTPLATPGTNSAIPLEITNSGWISGRLQVTGLGVIWNGSTGSGYTVSGTKELYAIAEDSGNIVSGGRASSGKLVKVETTTASPSTQTLTVLSGHNNGWFWGIDPTGSYLGGTMENGSGGYVAVFLDQSNNLVQLPGFDVPTPWDGVYDILIVNNQSIAAGQAQNNGGKAVLWFPDLKPIVLKDYVELFYNLSATSDSFTDFTPHRIASIEEGVDGWVLCGEGKNEITGYQEGFILKLPVFINSISK